MHQREIGWGELIVKLDSYQGEGGKSEQDFENIDEGRIGFSVFDHFGGGSDLPELTSLGFRSCICALILEGGSVPADGEN